jgi:hypothetical protein
VTGAYNATRTAVLETEALIPPIDIWLNGRLHEFEKRYSGSGVAEWSQARVEKARDHLRLGQRARARPRTQTRTEARAQKALDWNSEGTTKDEKVLADWIKRWEAEEGPRSRRARGQRPPTADRPPDANILRIHDGLTKVESSLLV